MNFLTKLAEIANQLDARGLYEEANILDNIIKEAQNAPPGWQSVHNFPEDVIMGRKPTVYNFPEDVITVQRPGQSVHNFPEDVIKGKVNPRMQQYVAGLDKLRKMLGLGPGNFDVDVARRLNKLNNKYPGVWVPGTGQKLSQIMANTQRALTKEFEYAQKAKRSPSIGGQTPVSTGPRDPGGRSVHPSNQQLFPSTSVPPVSLPEKQEFKL